MSASLVTTEELRKVPSFAVLSEDQLAYVAGEGDVARVARGEVYAREGEPEEHFCAILEGEFRISKRVDCREVTINTYAPGNFFGEEPLRRRTPIATTVAVPFRVSSTRSGGWEVRLVGLESKLLPAFGWAHASRDDHGRRLPRPTA